MRARILVLFVAIALLAGCGGSSANNSTGSTPTRHVSGPLVGVMFDGPVWPAEST
jgi:ABC-type glycerol-3-phosphate transport system substrate-binding protein